MAWRQKANKCGVKAAAFDEPTVAGKGYLNTSSCRWFNVCFPPFCDSRVPTQSGHDGHQGPLFKCSGRLPEGEALNGSHGQHGRHTE